MKLFFCLFQKELEDLQRRLVVLGCQLRKSEVSKRSYEVAVDKLTKFVEVDFVFTVIIGVSEEISLFL